MFPAGSLLGDGSVIGRTDEEEENGTDGKDKGHGATLRRDWALRTPQAEHMSGVLRSGCGGD